MQITVEDYSYVFVKLAVLRNIVMNASDLKRIANYQDIASLRSFVQNFFPGFNPTSEKIIDFERELWEIYFKIIEKIIAASPLSIQKFIQTYLLKYEIRNIEVNLLGIIANIPPETRASMVKEHPVKMLGRSELLNSLIKSKSLTELEIVMKESPYSQIFKINAENLRKSDEIFWLVCDLDKFYYKKLFQSLETFPDEEKEFLFDSILSIIDFYNINLIYRGLFNHIDMKRLKGYLLPYGRLLNAKQIDNLVKVTDLEQFIELFPKEIKNNKLSQLMKEKLLMKDMHVLEELRQIIFHPFFRSSTSKYIGDIPMATMSKIFDIILNKEFEIQEIVARAVQISFERR